MNRGQINQEYLSRAAQCGLLLEGRGDAFQLRFFLQNGGCIFSLQKTGVAPCLLGTVTALMNVTQIGKVKALKLYLCLCSGEKSEFLPFYPSSTLLTTLPPKQNRPEVLKNLIPLGKLAYYNSLSFNILLVKTLS